MISRLGAYVVRQESAALRIGTERIWPGHIGVIVLILLFAGASSGRESPRQDYRLRRAPVGATGVQSDPAVRHASAFAGINKFFSSAHGTSTTRVFSVKVIPARRVTAWDSLADRFAGIVLSRDPAAAQDDRIAVSMVYGYDIGIASASRSRTVVLTPNGGNASRRPVAVPTHLPEPE